MTATKNRPVGDEAAQKAFGGADVDYSTISTSMRDEGTLSIMEGDYLPEHWDRSTRLAWATESYLFALDRDDLPEPHELVSRMLADTVQALHIRPKKVEKGAAPRDEIMMPIPTTLEPFQVARLMMFKTPLALVELAPTLSELMVYQTSGPSEGTYSSDEEMLRLGVRKFVASYKTRDVDEVLAVLRQEAPRRLPNKEPHLSPVKNGVFNRLTQKLEPHSPERLFMFKGKVNCVPNAPLPVLHNDEDGMDWDPQSGIDDLMDDPELKILLWQLITMVVYPYHDWGLFPMLFNRDGMNGKGMLIKVMRQLSPRHSGANLDDMTSKFLPPELLTVSAVLADENQVGASLDNVSGFKALVTGDAVGFEAKFKDKFTTILTLVLIMCFNGFPKVKDRSGSFLRRLLWVPFFKTFKGQERKYIKRDYIERQDVLEYILWQALSSQHTKLSEPQACLDLKAEFMLENDSVRAFWDEFEERFAWNGLPWDFIYDLFKAWYASNIPMSKGAPGKGEFKKSMGEIMNDSDDWEVSAKFRTSNMVGPEPLIADWDLTKWKNPNYPIGRDVLKLSTPTFHTAAYPGIKRKAPVTAVAAATTSTAGEDA